MIFSSDSAVLLCSEGLQVFIYYLNVNIIPSKYQPVSLVIVRMLAYLC